MFLAALVAMMMLAAGAAYALWPTSGTGSGTVDAGTTSALTLSPAAPAAELYPGGQANVVLTVSNPNPGPIRIGSLSLSSGEGTGGFAVDGGHSGCPVAALSLATQTNGGSGWTVPARANSVDGLLDVTLTNALSMSSTAANSCQGATFTVYLTAVA